MDCKKRWWRALLLLGTVVCWGALWASAEEATENSAKTMFGVLNASMEAQPMPLSEAMPASSLQGMGFWDGARDGDAILWTITETKPEEKDGFPVCRLAFYSVHDEKAKPLGFYETIDGFVSAPVTRDADGQLVSVWTGGSAYHVVVFARSPKNGIAMVGEFGSRTIPELLYDAEMEPVLIACSKWQSTKGVEPTPEAADIFRLTPEGRYKLWKQVDWKKRLWAAAAPAKAEQRK